MNLKTYLKPLKTILIHLSFPYSPAYSKQKGVFPCLIILITSAGVTARLVPHAAVDVTAEMTGVMTAAMTGVMTAGTTGVTVINGFIINLLFVPAYYYIAKYNKELSYHA